MPIFFSGKQHKVCKAQYSPIGDLRKNWGNCKLFLQAFNKYLENVRRLEIRSCIDSITKYKQCSETLYRGLENIVSGVEVSKKADMQQFKHTFENILKNLKDVRKDCEFLKRVSSSQEVTEVIKNFIKVWVIINSALREVSQDNVLLLTFFNDNV